MFVIDPTISAGNLIQVAAMLGGGLVVLVTLRSTVARLQTDVGSVQAEVKKMGDILVKMAVAENRLDNTDKRLTIVEEDIRDLRRGKGFIRGHRDSVEGEYQ